MNPTTSGIEIPIMILNKSIYIILTKKNHNVANLNNPQFETVAISESVRVCEKQAIQTIFAPIIGVHAALGVYHKKLMFPLGRVVWLIIQQDHLS